MNRIELIRRILANAEIRDWYAAEHGISLDNLTAASVRAEHSVVAGNILLDGCTAGIITQDEYEAA